MNPFVQKEFISNWLKHFSSNRQPVYFNFINPIGFIKTKLSFLYYNIGRNITNGLDYTILDKGKDYKRKVIVIFDVISYIKESGQNLPGYLGLKKIKQYKGHLSRFTDYESYDDFLAQHYSSSTRRGLRKNEKRLKTNFNIQEKEVYGNISKDSYNELLDRVYDLIKVRFQNLGLDNDILNKKEYYRELLFDMILSKKAVIHTICHNEIPIAVGISFLSDRVVYYAITTFDVRYRRYNLGHLIITNVAKWCFENNYDILDYSKGTYEYKLRWSNEDYFFENHIIYDKTSIICVTTAWILSNYFKFKQFLRNRNLNETYVKLKFLLDKNKKESENKNNIRSEDFKDEDVNLNSLDKVAKDQLSCLEISEKIYDLLYSNPQPLESVEVFKTKDKSEYFVFAKGVKKRIIIEE
ncbi:MAG: GNAT family N-acetyltransferase [Allomuricauda sp.]